MELPVIINEESDEPESDSDMDSDNDIDIDSDNDMDMDSYSDCDIDSEDSDGDFDDITATAEEIPGPFTDVISAEEIPVQFSQWNQQVSWMHDMMEPGTYVLATLKHVEHPSRFYVQLDATQAEANAFYKHLQTWVYKDLMNKYSHQLKPCCIPKASCILPGLYILCRQVHLWHRARVLSTVKDGHILVEFIDTGSHGRVHIRDASYILPDMLTALRPQAIQCRLHFGNLYYSNVRKMLKDGAEWPTAAKTEFMKLLRSGHVGITFYKFKIETSDTNGVESGIWSVAVNALVRGGEQVAIKHMDGAESSNPHDVNAQTVFTAQVQEFDISRLFITYIPTYH